MLGHDDNDFSIQRRNLILVSAIILAKYFLEIDYDNFKILGDGIIGNPEGIKIILWILWVYFLFRFFSLFFEKESVYKKPIRKIFNNYQKIIVKHHIEKTGSIVENIDIMYFDKNPVPSYKVTYDETNIIMLQPHEFEGDLNRIILFKLKTLSLFNYVFKTHYFFEYYFPILFAFHLY